MTEERAFEVTEKKGFINGHLEIPGPWGCIHPQIQLSKDRRQPFRDGHYFAGVNCLITVVR